MKVIITHSLKATVPGAPSLRMNVVSSWPVPGLRCTATGEHRGEQRHARRPGLCLCPPTCVPHRGPHKEFLYYTTWLVYTPYAQVPPS